MSFDRRQAAALELVKVYELHCAWIVENGRDDDVDNSFAVLEGLLIFLSDESNFLDDEGMQLLTEIEQAVENEKELLGFRLDSS